MGAAMPSAVRVAAWDAAAAAVREHLRGAGLREVATAVRVDAVAVEPYIEAVEAPPGLLRTSPELAMKRLLCRGSGPIFQIGPVFRRAERGAWHREEFHLVEWYRLGRDLDELSRDVEELVGAVFSAVGRIQGVAARPPPSRWERVELLDLLAETLGPAALGTGDCAGVERALHAVRARAGAPFDPPRGDEGSADEPLRLLRLWTELFSLWSTEHLDPWLSTRPEVGVHLVGFPPPLAALAEVVGDRALRFESCLHGVELANGYRELRDAEEQRRRFSRVNRLRAAQGLAASPLHEAFLRDLVEPGLPVCCGAALGLERLVALACGCSSLAEIELG